MTAWGTPVGVYMMTPWLRARLHPCKSFINGKAHTSRFPAFILFPGMKSFGKYHLQAEWILSQLKGTTGGPTWTMGMILPVLKDEKALTCKDSRSK